MKKTAAPKPPKKQKQKPFAQKSLIKCIRLVMQLEDTPHNRKMIDEVYSVAKTKGVQGPLAVIHVAEMGILQMLTTDQAFQADASPQP